MYVDDSFACHEYTSAHVGLRDITGSLQVYTHSYSLAHYRWKFVSKARVVLRKRINFTQSHNL